MPKKSRPAAKREPAVERHPRPTGSAVPLESLGDWQRTHYSAELTPAMDGQKVILMGWVRALRPVGKVVFIQLADREGSVQLTHKPEALGELKLTDIQARALGEKIALLGREWVVAAKGVVRANKEAPGGLEVVPTELKILNTAEALPLEIVTKKVGAELPTRLDWRFLDLRKPEVAAIFDIADTLKIAFLNYFDQAGFININSPIIVGAATEGGAELFPVKYFDREAFLNQSPQLYKQMLMAAGFDKVSIVTPVFRAEPHDTYRHLNEMVQMDIEVAWVRDEEDALKWYDGCLAYMLEQVKAKCTASLKLLNIRFTVPAGIPRLTYDEALDYLGRQGIRLAWGADLTPEAERALNEKWNPVLITKWPSALRAFYAMEVDENPKVCRAYDLLYNGLEISSGAQREHRLHRLIERMKSKKLDPAQFKFYLDAFRYGCPPHAGWSIGLERLTMALLKLSNIREATLFPRTKGRLAP